jgi:hypothetical protein
MRKWVYNFPTRMQFLVQFFLNLARRYPYTLLVSVVNLSYLLLVNSRRRSTQCVSRSYRTYIIFPILYEHSRSDVINIKKNFHRIRVLLHRDFSPMHSFTCYSVLLQPNIMRFDTHTTKGFLQ